MHDTRWHEYDTALCEAMNSEPFLLLLANATLAHVLARDVDEACASLCDTATTTAATTTTDDGKSSKSVSTATAAAADARTRHDDHDKPLQQHEPTTSSATTASSCVSRHALTTMLRVQCTTAANQATVQRCLAVHGCVPCIAVVDPVSNANDFVAYVLDAVTDESNNNNNNNNNNIDNNKAVSDEDARQAHRSSSSSFVTRVRDFLSRVCDGVEAAAPQGAPPPHDDLFAPTHGVVLCCGRSAVTSTFARLVRGGAVCVCWSERCACCPGILMLIEALVAYTCRIAHDVVLAEQRKDDKTETNGSGSDDNDRNKNNKNDSNSNDDDDDAQPPPYIRYIACNIDDNDIGPREWPSHEENAHVPCVRVYRRDSGERILFTDERTAPALVDFLCCHCLRLDDDALVARVRSVAVARAHALDVDALMATLPDSSAAYQAAVHAASTLTSPSPACDTQHILACFAQARRELPWLRSTATTTTTTTTAQHHDARTHDDDASQPTHVKAHRDDSDDAGYNSNKPCNNSSNDARKRQRCTNE